MARRRVKQTVWSRIPVLRTLLVFTLLLYIAYKVVARTPGIFLTEPLNGGQQPENNPSTSNICNLAGAYVEPKGYMTEDEFEEFDTLIDVSELGINAAADLMAYYQENCTD